MALPVIWWEQESWLTASDRQGKQGHLDAASKAILSSEFDTEDEDEVIKKILTEGTAQTVEVSFSFPSLPPIALEATG